MRAAFLQFFAVSLFLLVAAAQAQADAAPPNPAPAEADATEGPGPYWIAGKLCGEDDCDNIPGRWRATAPADLFAAPDATAAIVAHLDSGEWVNATDKRTRYTPQRGVVSVAGGGLAASDVVYGPYAIPEEGRQQVWRRGERVTIDSDAEAPRIEWGLPTPDSPIRVMWVRIERPGKPGGWLRDPSAFACMGENAPADEGC